MRKKVGFASLLFVALALAIPFAPMSASAADCPKVETAGFNCFVRNTFVAPVPCAVACPYWVDTDDATCHPDPVVPGENLIYQDWDITLNHPSNPGQQIVFFVYALETPLVDYDGWICFQQAHESAPGVYFIDTSANIVGNVCGLVMFACAEKSEITVCTDVAWNSVPRGFGWQCIPKNTPITFRTYNWSDAAPVPAWACWSKKGIIPNSTDCAGVPFPGR